MLNIRINEKIKWKDHLSIHIKLQDTAVESGVYMFCVDGIPLYIGECTNFLERLAYHLKNLVNDASYFGLQDLNQTHEISYEILKIGYPYAPYKKENAKRKSDRNRHNRIEEQNTYINRYYPLTQNPIFIQETDLLTYKKSKDHLIHDPKKRNEIVKLGLEKHREKYDEIIKDLQTKKKQCTESS